MKKILVIIPLILLLSGCSLFQERQVEVSTTEVAKAPLIVPEVDQFQARSIKWIIITEDNAREIFSKLKKQGKAPALFALTADGYQALSLNMNDILKILKQQKAIVAAYRDYYESPQKDNLSKTQ